MPENQKISLQLGNGENSFAFSMSTAAFDSLEISTSWEWAEQKRVSGSPALQYTGSETQVITLTGVIFPTFKAGAAQLQKMRALGDRAGPLVLADSRGNAHGRWVIKSVNETQSTHFPDGTPRRQNYTLALARYD
jgi:phage protein U